MHTHTQISTIQHTPNKHKHVHTHTLTQERTQLHTHTHYAHTHTHTHTVFTTKTTDPFPQGRLFHQRSTRECCWLPLSWCPLSMATNRSHCQICIVHTAKWMLSQKRRDMNVHTHTHTITCIRYSYAHSLTLVTDTRTNSVKSHTHTHTSWPVQHTQMHMYRVYQTPEQKLYFKITVIICSVKQCDHRTGITTTVITSLSQHHE